MAVVDEGLHPAGEDADWQESVYLAWRDPVTGLGGNHRIGHELNRNTSNHWCGVYHEDGTRYRCNGEGVELERLNLPGLVAGPQRLFHDGDVLRFVLAGESCHMDVVIEDDPRSFTDATEGAFAGNGTAAGTILSSHFNAFGRVRGTVSLADRTAEVDAFAWRDHSWGVRRWDSFSSSRSFGGSFGDALQFRYGSMVGVNGAFFRRGSLVRDGEPLEVVRAEMLVTIDDDSLRCPAAEVRYHLADETTTTVRIDIIGGMLGVTGQRCGWESVGDVSVDGKPGGWGFLEVNNNPRNGQHVPGFALGDALVNGLHRS
ncbi:MAG: hypothetical protein WCE30_17595 [Mycobacterium sp.]